MGEARGPAAELSLYDLNLFSIDFSYTAVSFD